MPGVGRWWMYVHVSVKVVRLRPVPAAPRHCGDAFCLPAGDAWMRLAADEPAVPLTACCKPIPERCSLACRPLLERRGPIWPSVPGRWISIRSIPRRTGRRRCRPGPAATGVPPWLWRHPWAPPPAPRARLAITPRHRRRYRKPACRSAPRRTVSGSSAAGLWKLGRASSSWVGWAESGRRSTATGWRSG